MRLAFAASLLVSCLTGCGDEDRSLTGPTPPTVYTATLSASSSCSRQLPAGDAVRVYEVSSAGGYLLWSAPTITQSRVDQRSTLKVDGDTVSLVIGASDRQEDIFYGIWEDLGGARTLAISGHGGGRVEGSAMSGTFEGAFDAGGSSVPGTTCYAVDHHFTLTITPR
jgi:hypothetical protein